MKNKQTNKMGGLEIVARDRKGKIKQDLRISRTLTSGKVVEVNQLKEKEEKNWRQKNERRGN